MNILIKDIWGILILRTSQTEIFGMPCSNLKNLWGFWNWNSAPYGGPIYPTSLMSCLPLANVPFGWFKYETFPPRNQSWKFPLFIWVWSVEVFFIRFSTFYVNRNRFFVVSQCFHLAIFRVQLSSFNTITVGENIRSFFRNTKNFWKSEIERCLIETKVLRKWKTLKNS